MIAVDTNVLVRYVTNDDPEQARQALRILGGGTAVFVPKTVILELEWVLRAAYRLPPHTIEQALLTVLGLPNVMPEAADQLVLALEGYRQGLDFADALHYASAEQASAFVSFDVKLVRRGKALNWRVRLVNDDR